MVTCTLRKSDLCFRPAEENARALTLVRVSGKFQLSLMDSNTRRLENETREVRDSLHVYLALFL